MLMQRPILNYRGHEAVKFPDADRANFTSKNHALERSRMNAQKRSSFVAVEQRIGRRVQRLVSPGLAVSGSLSFQFLLAPRIVPHPAILSLSLHS